MDIEILSKNKSALPRLEISAKVKFDATTPSRLELKKAIAKKTGGNDALAIVKTIYTNYGEKEAIVTTYVYDNEEAMNKIEYTEAIKKNSPKTEEKKEGDA